MSGEACFPDRNLYCECIGPGVLSFSVYFEAPFTHLTCIEAYLAIVHMLYYPWKALT
jgi:hypothetical protein